MASSEQMNLAYDVFKPEGEHSQLPPIILLHGMTSSRITWKDLPDLLAQETKRVVYALDARNHGESTWSDEFGYDVMADDVARLMDQLEIPTATIIGHSMGGKTAMTLALAQPKKVEQLVIEDISPKLLIPLQKRFPYKYLNLLKKSLDVIPPNSNLENAKKTIADFLNNQMPTEHTGEPGRRDDGSTLPLIETPQGFAWQTNLDVLENIFNRPELIKEMRGLYEGRVVYICGTRSTYEVLNDKEYILKLFPNATFKSIEGSSHLVHLEYPEEFSQKVLDFLKEPHQK